MVSCSMAKFAIGLKMLNVDAMMVSTLLKMSVLHIMSVMKEFNIQINIVNYSVIVKIVRAYTDWDLI